MSLNPRFEIRHRRIGIETKLSFYETLDYFFGYFAGYADGLLQPFEYGWLFGWALRSPSGRA